VYARTIEESCWHEECWLLMGHKGLHAYHPAVSGEETFADDKEDRNG
jgi:hypothetical protein